MAPQETEEELLAGAAGLSLGTDGEVSGSARGAVLRALFLPAPVFHFFVRVANRGGGFPCPGDGQGTSVGRPPWWIFLRSLKGRKRGVARGSSAHYYHTIHLTHMETKIISCPSCSHKLIIYWSSDFFLIIFRSTRVKGAGNRGKYYASLDTLKTLPISQTSHTWECCNINNRWILIHIFVRKYLSGIGVLDIT